METKALDQFLKAVKQDPELQQKLRAEGADPLLIAKEAGFEIDPQMLTESHQLSDEALEFVNGGGLFPASWLGCGAAVNVTNNQVFVNGQAVPSGSC